MRTFDHIVLTRFNLPTPGAQGVIRAREGWLRDRVGLFERYCIPAIEDQSNCNFEWLVYFDPASPEWLRNRITNYSDAGILRPVFRETATEAELITDIEGIVGSKAQDLLTTNLDNDDAIATGFIDTIQSASPANNPTAIYLTDGLIQSQGKLYLHRYPRNAFNSVRSSWECPVTCWAEWHTDFERLMPVIEIAGPPAWMQVVHGSNVSNRVKGSLVSPLLIGGDFGGLLDDVAEPRTSQLLKDRVVDRPIRFISESGRMAIKKLVLGAFGRDGLDRSRKVWRQALGTISKPSHNDPKHSRTGTNGK